MNIAGIVAAVESHALSLGRFDSVNWHEPKNAPGGGITCSIWADSVGPASEQSGLTKTTARVGINVRLYVNMTRQPQDHIDPDLLSAVDVLLDAYSGDFTLGGIVRNVDLLGHSGAPLSGEAGYITIDQTMYRVFTITLPLIVNDAFSQAA